MSSNKRVPQKRSEAPFRDEEILRADDPRPQRVTQYPVKRNPRKSGEEHIPTGVFDTEKHDEELRASYGKDAEDNFKPVFIYVERGPGQGQLVQVKQGQLVVGRASISDLRLQHPSISRRHAQISRMGEQFYLKDLGSQNGTFVNKQRIATEIEIFPGDSIAMGNAMMKLRGPLQKGEQLKAPTPQRKVKTPMKTAILGRHKSSNAAKIAIFAGAVGFGLAGVLAIALLKLPGDEAPTPRPTKRAARADATKPAEDFVVAVDEVKTKVIDDAIAKRMAEAQKPINLKEEPAEKSAPTPAPAEKAAAPAPRQVASVSSAPASSGGGKRSILGPYERGELDDALEAAQKAGEKDLAGKISAFSKAFDAAYEAENEKDGTKAIKNFEQALKIDEQIVGGAISKKGQVVRKELSKLYTMVGLLHVKQDDEGAAKQAFQAALKIDPSNEDAKSQLRKLGGEAPEAAAPKAKKASKASADDAFGDDDDEKPAKKAAPAKKASPKSRSQAIDDAFGD
jgi:pSer/pThr/pTyr-binding forkhead associated (FHA) protein/tetratricopeptide (TPR) repeat protein